MTRKKDVKYLTEKERLEANLIQTQRLNVFWSIKYASYVCLCWTCRQWYLSDQPHAVTCSDSCRQERSRQLREK